MTIIAFFHNLPQPRTRRKSGCPDVVCSHQATISAQSLARSLKPLQMVQCFAEAELIIGSGNALCRCETPRSGAAEKQSESGSEGMLRRELAYDGHLGCFAHCWQHPPWLAGCTTIVELRNTANSCCAAAQLPCTDDAECLPQDVLHDRESAPLVCGRKGGAAKSVCVTSAERSLAFVVCFIRGRWLLFLCVRLTLDTYLHRILCVRNFLYCKASNRIKSSMQALRYDCFVITSGKTSPALQEPV